MPRRLRTLSEVGPQSSGAPPFVGQPCEPVQNLCERHGISREAAEQVLRDHDGHAGRASRALERQTSRAIERQISTASTATESVKPTFARSESAKQSVAVTESVVGRSFAGRSAPVERTSSRMGLLDKMFDRFDQDGDGHWSFQEARRFMLIVFKMPMTHEEFVDQCDEYGVDPEVGLPKDIVLSQYDAGDIEDDYERSIERLDALKRSVADVMATGTGTATKIKFFRLWDEYRNIVRDKEKAAYNEYDPTAGDGGEEQWEEQEEEDDDDEEEDAQRSMSKMSKTLSVEPPLGSLGERRSVRSADDDALEEGSGAGDDGGEEDAGAGEVEEDKADSDKEEGD
eukprot:Hpha_TRINITY_DN16859_c1_g10::TRINITY_DN16859_c1_g10_i1::g.152547::m.152547